MRIVAGKYRGKKLYSPSDDAVRPTTDRIKETVFNIIQWDVAGARVLDLFAGSGALGIECISRGAEEVVFVDRSPSSIALIKENLKGIEGNYRVVGADFLGVLRAGSDKFDLIFVDPPFRSGLGETAVCAALDSQRLAEGGTIVYEHSTELPFVPTRDDITVRTKRMGTVTVDFVRRKKTALFAGTFDPVTKGHIAVIDEALKVFDEVTAGILVNPDKDCFFTPEERLEILNAALSDKRASKPFIRRIWRWMSQGKFMRTPWSEACGERGIRHTKTRWRASTSSTASTPCSSARADSRIFPRQGRARSC